jgi:hypothetical protein
MEMDIVAANVYNAICANVIYIRGVFKGERL